MPVLIGALSATAVSAADRFVKPTGAGAACTQSAPCTLAAALASAADGDRVLAARGTYTGTGTEVAVVDRPLSLLGGWDGAAFGPVVRDPVANEVVIDGQNARRGVRITAAAAMLDGFTITRGNASGQVSDCGNGSGTDGCGGGVFVAAAGVTISNNRIEGNVAATAPAAGLQRFGYGGGVMAYHAADVVIESNTIVGNVAHTGNSGRGGGIDLDGCQHATVRRNHLTDNTGTSFAGDHGWGGGVAFSGSDAVIEHNVLNNNRANPDRADDGNALYAWLGSGTMRRNRVASDNAGSAIFLGYFSGSLAGNSVRLGRDGQAVALYNGTPVQTVMTNNVLVGGPNADQLVYVLGYDEAPIAVELEHNTIVGGGGTTAVYAGASATVTMVNNLLDGHVVPLQTASNGTITADHTLFWNIPSGLEEGSNPIVGDPHFVNRAAGDFHIWDSSAAFGAGVDAGVTVDMEGDHRPSLGAPDIGADEVAPRQFDFGTASSPIADGATQVTPATTYAAGAGYGWLDGAIDARDRGGSEDQATGRDFNFTREGTFAVDLPSGRYWLWLTVGDPALAHSQMAITLEGSQVAVVNTAKGEVLELPFTVALADGQLTVHLKDLGGGDPNVVLNGLTITDPYGARFDFGTSTSPQASGFERATSAAPAPLAGAGWTGGSRFGRDRQTLDPLLRDFVFTPRGLFEAVLQDGDYDVTVTLGDPGAAHDQMGATVQGLDAAPATVAKGGSVKRFLRCGVADSRLQSLFRDLGGSDPNVAVQALEMVRPRIRDFDFGLATSPVAFGYLGVTESTLYADGRGWGWTDGAVNSRDRGAPTDLKRDFVFSRDATFSVDVVPGPYHVAIYVGDATTKHDQMAIYLEGDKVATLTTLPGQFTRTLYPVLVLDGRLDVRIADEGGSDPNAMVSALEIR